MIGHLAGMVDSLLGRGEAAVTVPPLDGPLKPNCKLDEAQSRSPLDGADCLAIDGENLVASAGAALFALGADGDWMQSTTYESPIAALATVDAGGLAVALDDGGIAVEGGRFAGRTYRVAGVTCITAMAGAGDQLYVSNGSAQNRRDDWQRDLLERKASGSVWRIDLDTGAAVRIAEGLAWPAGLATDGDGLIVSEAWKHRLIHLDPARPQSRRILLEDLPAYPGRMATASDGTWLAMFAPRSQLVEFVLREPAYRRRMMAEVPEPFWVSPKLRAGRSFYESLQGGGVKHLGLLKPWAPTMSAGLCVKLDRAFQPRASLHSRADGRTHGITSAVEHGGRIFAAARGDGVVVSLSVDETAVATGVRT